MIKGTTLIARVLAAASVALIGVAAASQDSAPATPAPNHPAAAQPTHAHPQGPAGQPPPTPAADLPRSSTPGQAVLVGSPPLRLEIPAIGVSTSLVELGLTADGELQVPVDFDLAGWYQHGPTPGKRGPAVIAGHVDSVKDGPAVFFRLAELSAGVEVEVSRADGRTAVFAVARVEQHPKADFPTAAVYGNTAGSTLRLITCGGSFDRGTGHYRDNIVAYADLVDVRGSAVP